MFKINIISITLAKNSEWKIDFELATLSVRDLSCAVSGFGPAQKPSGPKRYCFDSAEPITGTIKSV